MSSSYIPKNGRLDKRRHFIRAMSKTIHGRPLTQSERTLLDSIFEALLRGEDVSDLTGISRPHTRRSADRIYVALHYLCLTQLLHTPADVAWRVVGDAWGLRKRDVRWIIVRNHEPAQIALQHFTGAPDRLLRICERHARGTVSERDGSGQHGSSQGPGDDIIPMLARLFREQPPTPH
ncbi:MAG: hypothetical protein U1F09_02915 [Steroidobacteraceae bacterium]